MEILFKNSNIIVAVKPVGIPTETRGDEKCITDILGEQQKTDIHLLHRLDRNVGGVMVFATNKNAAAKLSAQIQSRAFQKEYLAVVDSAFQQKSGEMKDLLFKDSKRNRSFVVDRMRKGVKEASLQYSVLAEENDKSLVNVLLHTGRTHQIRVQFASRKAPLTGDGKYGSHDNGADIALWSHKITFINPSDNKEISFSSYPDGEKYPWNLFGGEYFD